MSHKNLEIVNQALRAHRSGATIRDLEQWSSRYTNNPVQYRTVKNCLCTLQSLGLARCDVESTSGIGTYTRRRWFARRIID